MSKRPKSFQKFKPPKKLAAEEEREKKEDPAPADQPVQPKAIQPLSSSESEQETPGPSHLAKPATGNLVVTNSHFDLINQHLNNIYPFVKRRAQVILNHDAIAEALNSSHTPNTIRISDQLPRPPHGVSFSDNFVKAHKEKVKHYARRLSQGIANEYKSIAETLQAEIDKLVEAAEATLFMIIDEEEQGRCVQLFRVKLQSLYRRVNNGNSRRQLKGKRRLDRK